MYRTNITLYQKNPSPDMLWQRIVQTPVSLLRIPGTPLYIRSSSIFLYSFLQIHLPYCVSQTLIRYIVLQLHIFNYVNNAESFQIFKRNLCLHKRMGL